MKLKTFIHKTKLNPLQYISYCEIAIDRNGDVYEVCPSHENACIKSLEKIGISRDELENELPDMCSPVDWIVDKYGIIALWYNMYIISSTMELSEEQKHTLKILKENNLLNKNATYYVSKEYKNYLYREELMKKEKEE